MRAPIVLAALAAIASAQGPADDPGAIVFLGPLGAGKAAPAADTAQRRVILTDVARAKAWAGVFEVLKARGYDEVVPFRGRDLKGAFKTLARLRPGFVAVVVTPQALDVNLHFDLVERASRLDDDPFVDFAFGYITGASPEEAVAFARGIRAAARARLDRTILEFGPTTQPSGLGPRAPHRTAKGFKVRRYAHAADAADVAANLKRAGDVGIFHAWGHGYPDGVHEGLKGSALRASGLDLHPALYFSGPCYCGVASGWYSTRGGRVTREALALKDSFLLALVKARPSGIFAGLDPDRGETNHHEFEYLLTTGDPLGMASKCTYDEVVVAYRRPTLELPRYEPGRRRPHRDIHDTMISGGACRALFGDPTLQPVDRAARDPFAADTKWTKDGLEVTWKGGSDLGRFWAPVDVFRAEGRWTHRLRFRVDVPLDRARTLKGLKVLAVDRDGQPLAHTYATGAVESWAGRGRVHLMVIFPYHPKERALWGGRRYEARFLLTFAEHTGARTAAAAPPRGPSRSAALTEAAARRNVGEGALAAARAAFEATLSGAGAAEALARLKTFREEGFRATLALLEAGRSHYRVHELVRATYHPGAERELVALAEGPALPNYASWAVLESLGVADTAEVRRYLLERIAREKNAGLYMSAAQALGALGEARGATPVGERILEFREGWSGVEPHLLAALARMDGERAAAYFVRFLADERATRGPGIRTALGQLRGYDPEKARDAARELARSERMDGLDEAVRGTIEEIAR